MSNNKNSKFRKFYNVFEKLFKYVGTPLMGVKLASLGKSYITERSLDDSYENTVGYDNINLYYNTNVHSNNFVMLHVSTSNFNDITYLRERLTKCNENGISVGLILDTKATDLASIYKDVDYLQAVVKEYKIDLPIYCNIDYIMENSDLNNAQRNEIIHAFIDKANKSDMYLGVYGKDSNLVDCDTYIYDLRAFDCFVVQDSPTIRFDGTCNLKEDLDGVITAEYDLANVITSKGLNSAHKMVYSSSYEVKEGDTYHSLGLQFGLSENDLIKYNNGKDVLIPGDNIYIPNLYKTVDEVNQTVRYNYAVARGIDISDYQVNLDWERIAETSDYVIVEVSRDKDVFEGEFINSCIPQIVGVTRDNLGLGLYFCIYDEMDVEVYAKNLEEYLTTLDSQLAACEVILDKENVPVFLDFERYSDANNYYELISTFENICKDHGFSKVGIYGNGTTLNAINNSLVKDGKDININDTNWFVWKSGGPQYSSRENTTMDDVTLDELIELECEQENGYIPVMQQVTNVCTDTGAANDMGHCDVSFLYDASIFGDEFADKVEKEGAYAGTVEIDLKNYPNVPVNTVLQYVDLSLSAAYILVAVKIIGTKLFVGLKNKVKQKGNVKKLTK